MNILGDLLCGTGVEFSPFHIVEDPICSVEYGAPQCGISVEFLIPHKLKGLKYQAMNRYPGYP